MAHITKIVLIVSVGLMISLGLYKFFKKEQRKKTDFFQVNSYTDIEALFPRSVAGIEEITSRSIKDAQKSLDAMINIPHEQRTYQNTVHALDTLAATSDFALMRGTLSALELVSPQEDIRTAAHAAIKTMNDFWIDAVEQNEALYNALKKYAYGNREHEILTAQQEYFLTKTLEDFKRGGLELPTSEREVISNLKKELAKLAQEFEVNIAQDNRTITVDRAMLEGLDEDFIASLPKAEKSISGEQWYTVGVDYPTYFNVMENCVVEETRKKLYRAFNNRAYPINEANLNLVIAKRDDLAHRLGFASYDAYDLDDQMVKSPERAQQFLQDLRVRASKKAQQEIEHLIAEKPKDISLAPGGKIKPWDLAYIKAQHKKKHFTLDEREVAQYFPMQKTIDGLLDIYKQFLRLDFKDIAYTGFWHEDVRLIEVYDATTHQLLGYLLLDLYPRPNKFSHACNITLVPAVLSDQLKNMPAVSLVVANFPKPTAAKPSLLKREDVNTFFHEFGHALHGLLGRTSVASFSGTSVKGDFVELPSQMLEEWLWDKDILKKISSHYVTGEPLPDWLVDNILRLKNFDSGYWTVRQLFYALLSLAYFDQGAQKNVNAIMRDLFEQTMPFIAFDPDNHTYASFGHLMGYGAKYYGYMWSKVFALDLFYEIKKQGLLNPVIGKKYIQEVIGKGGSQDPNELLYNFLGREPNQEAFLKDLGL